jgi:hypothetical protein
MKLLTKEILKKATSQYELGSDMEKQNIVAKFFDPYGSWTWFLMNIDPKDNDYCWGIVDGFAAEVGSFSIKELESISSPFGGPRIERDKFWTPKKAIDVFNEIVKRN